MINLSSFIAFHARRTPDRCALKYRGEDISYAEFDARIRRVGGWLAARGIGPGDVVAVLMKNSTAFLELVFATSHIGAVFLPINYRLSADEVGYIVGNSGARILIADEELADIAAGSAPVVLLDEATQSDATRLAPDIAPAPMHIRQPRDLMRLMYTSGTTDRPKGVMLTYENLYWKSADQTLVLGLNADTRLLVVGPLYHVGALDLPGIAVLWHGGMLSIHRNFEPEQALAAIESGETQRRLVRTRDDDRDPHLPCSQPLRRIEPAMGDRRRREDAGNAHPRLLRLFQERPLHRRLWPDRNLRRRHFYGSWPRDRKDRLDRPRHRPRRNRNP